jgi:hypothetical protein
LGPLTIWTKLATLACAVLLITVGIVFVLWRLDRGILAMQAVGAAAVICFSSGGLALLATRAFPSPRDSVAAIGLGTLVRMGLPLAAVLIAQIFGVPLVNAGFVYYLLTFYVVVLIMDTLLSLPAQLTK